jgi:hypothetical protein
MQLSEAMAGWLVAACQGDTDAGDEQDKQSDSTHGRKPGGAREQ